MTYTKSELPWSLCALLSLCQRLWPHRWFQLVKSVTQFFPNLDHFLGIPSLTERAVLESFCFCLLLLHTFDLHSHSQLVHSGELFSTIPECSVYFWYSYQCGWEADSFHWHCYPSFLLTNIYWNIFHLFYLNFSFEFTYRSFSQTT